MPEGKMRGMAVGVRNAMAVDWMALTLGVIGAGAAIIALIVLLERDAGTTHDCVVHSDQAQGASASESCVE